MELKDAIKRRVSVRSYLPDPVPEKDIREIIALGRKAPSVNNSQPWKFIVITNRELLAKMAESVSGQLLLTPRQENKNAETNLTQVERFATFFRDAPAVIALAVEPYVSVLERGANLSHDEINRMRGYPDIQSAGACMQNMLLAAVDLGYGACWLSAPLIAREDLENMLDVREPWQLNSFIALGKPKAIPESKTPRILDDVITFFS